VAETKTEEPKKLEPKVSQTEVGPCKVKLSVEISKEKVQEIIDGKYKELNDNVALPGFRKGHAPRRLLERKFGKSVLDDLKRSLLTDSFDEVKESTKLEPVGEPDIDVDSLAVREGEAFAYEITVEVMPQVEVKDYLGIELAKPPIEVTDAEIDAAVAAVREQRAEWTPLGEDEKARENDQIIGDFVLKHQDRTIDASENVQLELTPNVMLYQRKLEHFSRAIEGRRPGDAAELEVTLPDDHPDKDLAGKSCTLHVSLKSVKRKRLPEVDEKLFKALDVDDLAELRELLSRQVRKGKETDAREALKDQLMDKLLEANTFVVPEALQKAAEERMAERLRANYMMHGVAKERLEEEIQKQGVKVRDLGLKALRGQMILEAIAARERIFVTEGMLEEKIGQMAQLYEVRPDQMRELLEEQDMIPSMRREYRAELTRDFLLQKAKVVEPAAAPPAETK
jgi:trigger factor